MTEIQTTELRAVTERLLASPRWELAPVKDPLAKIDELPPSGTVTMGCFATSEGFKKTIDLTVAIASKGYDAVPHLPVRSLRDKAHLKDVLDAYKAGGVSDIFVVAGNTKKPVGPFEGVLPVLEDVAAAGFEVGVGAYPEGHLYLSEAEAFDLLREKQKNASYLVTQTCFDAMSFRDWLVRLRDAGVTLPAHLGIAGVVQRKELLRMAGNLGFGASIKFINKQRSLATKLMLPGAYDPTSLFFDIAEVATDTSLGIAGIHLNTFNQVAPTRTWWESLSV